MRPVPTAGRLDGWTMDAGQYELMRTHILNMIDEETSEDGSIALGEVVRIAQERYAAHPLFPGGRTRNYCTFTKVDLEARCEIERVPRSSPQRIWRPSDPPARQSASAARYYRPVTAHPAGCQLAGTPFKTGMGVVAVQPVAGGT